MIDIRKEIPNTAATSLPAVLLPHQQEWIADDSPLKVDEKGRRTGITWAEAADDVLIAASDKKAGGMNVFYIGYNQDMGLEYIESCAMWAKAFNYAAGDIEEGFWDEDQEDKHIKTFTIRFPDSGNRIVALSSRPANLRGKQGVVVIDEAAFHDRLDELLKAAIALLIWGGKVRVISTHNGEDNPFNELISEIRSGKRAGTVHHHPFRQAVELGLYRRVCLRLGKEWNAEEELAWVDDVYSFYGEDAAEELDAVPKGGNGIYLSNVLIEKRMSGGPVVRLAYNSEFALKPVDVRRSECEAWLDQNVKPILDDLDPNLSYYYGQDFGRSGDLSVLKLLSVLQDMRRCVPFSIEMRNVPFDQQQQILVYVVTRLPRFMAGKHDARGNGQQLAEFAADKFGHDRIEQVMLSVEWYRNNMPPLKAAFEDDTIAIERDSDVRSDLRAIQMIKGVARIPEDYRGKGSDGKQRHADSAIALALAYAATTADVAPIEYRGLGRANHTGESSRRDFNRPDHSGDMRRTGRFRSGSW